MNAGGTCFFVRHMIWRGFRRREYAPRPWRYAGPAPALSALMLGLHRRADRSRKHVGVKFVTRDPYNSKRQSDEHVRLAVTWPESLQRLFSLPMVRPEHFSFSPLKMGWFYWLGSASTFSPLVASALST